jgi:hypothetical protein
MEAGRPHRHVETAPQEIALRCVEVVSWDDGERPVWLQLALPRLAEREQAWFEGSVDPWRDTEAPRLDWTSVEPLLLEVGLGQPMLDGHEQRLLHLLPFVHESGIARISWEVWGGESGARARFFPTLGFVPIEGDFGPSFRSVRLAVGVIRNVVVTVRLPDFWWNDHIRAFEYIPGGPLEIAPGSCQLRGT